MAVDIHPNFGHVTGVELEFGGCSAANRQTPYALLSLHPSAH